MLATLCTNSLELSQQTLDWENSELITKIINLVEITESDAIVKEGLNVLTCMMESSLKMPQVIL